MAWTLEITHLDVDHPGDATLVVARESVSRTVRSMLIDGGRLDQANFIDRYLQAQKITALNVIVVSHYDLDHVNGIIGLLNKNITRYDNTIIFDRGEPGDLMIKTSREDPSGYVISGYSKEANYLRYTQAIASRGARQRITEKVTYFKFNPRATTVPSRGLVAQGWKSCESLLNCELLWAGVAVPAGAPTVKCIAVNQFVLTDDSGGNQQAASSGLNADRNENQKSLAVKITFNGFKYYAGGDLETTQENVAQNYLNPTNDLAGRVFAMKTSHHGSEYSTSDAFLRRLKPVLAFISCGTMNIYAHPTQRVVSSLSNSKYIASYYLTGEDLRHATSKGDATANIGPDGEVAGVWPANQIRKKPGNVKLILTEASSRANPLEMAVTYDQPDAGTNYNKDDAFAYTPWDTLTDTFSADIR